MYCILVTGMPATGKSTLAGYISEKLKLPMISKDSIKEIMFDTVGFQSRAEKVVLGVAAMDTMYYFADRLMSVHQPLILENNFENSSKQGLEHLLEQYGYTAVTIFLTGDYKRIYQRFLERNASPTRHQGHVVNDCYPQRGEKKQAAAPIPYDTFVKGFVERGMVDFKVKGPRIQVDTTDWDQVDYTDILRQVKRIIEEIS